MLLIVRCICICLYRKGLERNGIAKAGRAEKPQSGVKGVTWHLQTKSWKVSLRINDKQLHGGYFKLNKGLSWHGFMYLAIVKSSPQLLTPSRSPLRLLPSSCSAALAESLSPSSSPRVLSLSLARGVTPSSSPRQVSPSRSSRRLLPSSSPWLLSPRRSPRRLLRLHEAPLAFFLLSYSPWWQSQRKPLRAKPSDQHSAGYCVGSQKELTNMRLQS